MFWAAQPFPFRGCRVPSKVHFTAKHLTVLGLFEIALSKRRAEKKGKSMRSYESFLECVQMKEIAGQGVSQG